MNNKYNNDLEFKGNEYTHNRKLKIEEYNNEGNLIDVIELNQEDMWNFYLYKINIRKDMDISRKEDREHFKGKELELARSIRYLYGEPYNKKMIKVIEDMFSKYKYEQIEFALNFYQNPTEFYIAPKDYNYVNNMKFTDILEWTSRSPGLYYAALNDGSKGMLFLQKPTKKQAYYQRNKGNRIIFLNFEDWKEYVVREKEL